MIPSPQDIFAGFEFLAQRRGWTGALNPNAITDAVSEARKHAVNDEDEPAALFFALARRPKGLGEAWAVLPSLLARNVATGRGIRLRATDEELGSLRVAIVVQHLPFEDVRRWFAERS